MHFLLMYDYVDDFMERRGPFREGHLALITAAHERGELLMAGALGDAPAGGVLVWHVDDPAPIEAFMAADPYMSNGIVTGWRIRPWTVVVGGAAT